MVNGQLRMKWQERYDPQEYVSYHTFKQNHTASKKKHRLPPCSNNTYLILRINKIHEGPQNQHIILNNLRMAHKRLT